MPEVHIIGELLGGSGFKDNNLFAQWKIITEEESRWELIRGHDTGTTHLDAGNTVNYNKFFFLNMQYYI